MRANIPTTIIEQLGGGRFIAMTGAKNFIADGNCLRFTVGRGAKQRINRAHITLNDSDLYDVEFLRISKRGLECETIQEETNVHAAGLRMVFTSATGFDTHL